MSISIVTSRILMAMTASSVPHIRFLSQATITGACNGYTERLMRSPPDLIDWVRKEGGLVHDAVKVAQSKGSYGLGLVASENILKGTHLIALPNHLPLKLDALESDGENGLESVLVDLARQVPEKLWALKLGLKLLRERAIVDSFWYPYICNLPETYSVPIFFSGDDIKNLQYAPLVHQVNKRCRFLLDFEKTVQARIKTLNIDNHPFGGKHVDASSLGWAMSAVSSRAFRLHNRQIPGCSVPMMLPLIDMCNHSFTPNARIVQEHGVGVLVKVVTETHIEQGEALVINYGCLSNDDFLIDYGFIVTPNQYDYIELKYDEALLDAASTAAGVSSPSFSLPSLWQQKYLTQLHLSGDAPCLEVSIGGKEVVDGRLLGALRILLASDEGTLQKLDIKTLKSFSGDAPAGIRAEIGALRTILALCVMCLGHFPTNLREDESLLKECVCELGKLAIGFRMGKKSVIVDVIKELGSRISSLESASAENL